MAGTMHLSPRERFIYEFVKDEPWNGSVEAPSGAFISAHITHKEARDFYQQVLGDYWEVTPAIGEVVGNFLILEDDQGFVHVTEYPDEDTMADAERQLSEMYDTWNADEEGIGA